MKKTFPGYYRPTEDEFSELWQSCLFVLDANVLLNLYRYSPETSEELIGILKEISDCLWVPHQAALEYQRNRLSVIGQQAAAYDAIQEELRKAQDKIDNELRSFARHPFIEIDRLLERIKSIFTEIEKELNDLKQEHPDLLDGDHIRDAVTALLEGKVGSPYSSERMDEIYKEGKTRYEHDIPPGYLDKDKGGTRQYGDLVLWFQIIDKAKETKKPIIFITDDRKDDWWWRFRGETIGPKPELVEEIVSKADVSFYVYQADRFMEHAQEYLEQQVKQEAIDEVRDVRRRDEEYMKTIQAVAAYPLFMEESLRVVQRAVATAVDPRLMEESLRVVQRAVATAVDPRLMEESLRTMQRAVATAVDPCLMEESLRTMQRAVATAVDPRLMGESLRTMQRAVATAVDPRLMEESLRAMQQAVAAAVTPYLMAGSLRAMHQEKAPRISDEITEGITEDDGIVSDSEPEEEPDEAAD